MARTESGAAGWPPSGENLDALIAPRSVAIVGASSDRAKLSGLPLYFLRRHGYAGRVFPINPRGGEAEGVRIYRSLTEVGEPIDLAMVLLPSERVREAVHECAAAGVRAAIISASGFAEMSEAGRREQEELVALARAHGMRLLGPNCMGLVNLRLGAAVSFSQSLSLEQLRPGNLAFLSQSGAIGGSVMDLCHSRGIGLSHWISTGNQADVDVVEGARYLLRDEQVQIVALYMESIGAASAYLALLEEASAAGKALLVAKAGQSVSGRRAAASHTGALAGDDAVFRAVTRQAGAILVTDVEELVDLAAGLVRRRPARGNRIGIVSSSGGVGVMLADEADRRGLLLAPLAASTRAALSDIVPPYGSTANPVDVTASLVAQMIGGESGLWQRAFELVAADPSVDQLVVGLTMITGAAAQTLADEVIAADQTSQKPMLVTWLGGNLCRDGFSRLAEAGIPTYPSTARALRAAAALGTGAWEGDSPGAGATVDPTSLRADVALQEAARGLPSQAVTLTEWECGPLLRAAGISTPRGTLARSAEEARQMAAVLGERVALKVQSASILHKTDVGAVRLGVRSVEAGAVYADLMAAASRVAPGAQIQGVLVQEMAPVGRMETLVGVTRDPEFGLVLAFGAGGALAEVLDEVQFRRLPLSVEQVRHLSRDGRTGKVLGLRRGDSVADLPALVQALCGVVRLADALGARLLDLEINPLLVGEEGRGAVALDCLIRLRGGDRLD